MQPQRPSLSVVIRIFATIALCFGVFGFLPKTALADLTSPSVVVGGDAYGKVGTLGNYPEDVWRQENQKNRKLIYVNPASGSNFLVAAFVNDASCSGILCRLEFRMSVNNGLTWSQALAGSTTWLDIAEPEYDYTLTLGPNGQDIWVSYVDSAHVSLQQHSTKIAKLVWSSSAKTWTIARVKTPVLERQSDFLSGCWDNIAYFGKSTASVFVQEVAEIERVWVVATCRSGANQYTNVLTYCDNFSATETSCTAANDWQVARDAGNNKIIFDPWGWDLITSYQTRTTFVPIGNDKIPALIMVPTRMDLKPGSVCQTVGAGRITIQVGNKTTNSWLNEGDLKSVQPFAWSNNCTFAGSGFRPFDYSVASLPVSANTSRVVVAYEGGFEPTTPGTDYTHKVRVTSCLVSAVTGVNLASCQHAAIKTNTGADIDAYAPSVGFIGTTAWLAMQSPSASPNDNLIVSKEKVGSDGTWSTIPATYEWEGIGDSPAGIYPKSKSAQTPSMAGYISDASLLTNAGLPPIIWSQKDDKKVSASANMGGTEIGTSASSLPVLGWGWSSNFGWLSLNCANNTNCVASAYGVGIGVTSSTISTGNTFSAPDGYPLGGFAWSANAGWVSFERKDSVNSVNNQYGNPPHMPYNNSANVNDPIIKYDTKTQSTHGWGRFLDLCDFDSIKCQNPDKGWLKMQGYWLKSGATGTVSSIDTINNRIYLSSVDGFSVDAGNGYGVFVVNGNYYKFTSVDIPNKYLAAPIIPVAVNDVVYAASGTDPSDGKPNGGPYGVQAYWTGSNYEFSGWAWSNEYGWIRFNPLIFIGYAWMETLYGNIYVNGDANGNNGSVQLPDAFNLSGDRLNTCGKDTDEDGIGNEPCYVSTYRIEASGSISGLTYSATNRTIPGASSAVGDLYLKNNICGFGTDPVDPSCAAATGDINDTLLSQLLTRGSSTSDFGYPSVTPSSSTYRNALGKLDVGGLTTSVNTPQLYENIVGAKDIKIGANRFGNKLYVTSEENNQPVPWTVGQLLGQQSVTWPICNPACPADWPLASLQNQVVHVQGDLTVGQDPTTTYAAATTLSVGVSAQRAAIDVAGGTLTVPSNGTQYFPTTGALILGTASGKEEYMSYTGKTATTFTNVRTITGNPYSSGDHAVGTTVRWVWRWSFTNDAVLNPKPQNMTIVVDGNLIINYNIIASDKTKDADLISQSLANIGIKNAHAVAFVVKGNVIIAKEVNKITGAYIVTSRDTEKAADDVGVSGDIVASVACTDPKYTGCGGVFTTGNDNDPAFCSGTDKTCNPLKIEGLLFARLFSFQRIGNRESIDVPAEQVTFDQRLFLNPPPGLEDLTKALPNPTRQLP